MLCKWLKTLVWRWSLFTQDIRCPGKFIVCTSIFTYYFINYWNKPYEIDTNGEKGAHVLSTIISVWSLHYLLLVRINGDIYPFHVGNVVKHVEPMLWGRVVGCMQAIRENVRATFPAQVACRLRYAMSSTHPLPRLLKVGGQWAPAAQSKEGSLNFRSWLRCDTAKRWSTIHNQRHTNTEIEITDETLPRLDFCRQC